MTSPVQIVVDPPEGERNRLSVLVRPLLSIPHLVLVGGPLLMVFTGLRTGVLGLVALVIALFDWVAILATGRAVEGLQGLKRLYLRWRVRALAYFGLLRDEFPPLGDAPYPTGLVLPEPPETRERLAVALRPLLVLPHLVALLFLTLAWLVVTVVAWVAILATGHHPPELWRFTRDVTRYALRVEAYLLLVHDRFPAFALADEEEAPALAAG